MGMKIMSNPVFFLRAESIKGREFCKGKHNSNMVKKQAGDTSPEKLRLGPGAKTKAFGVAPVMTISKGDVEASVNRKVKSPLKVLSERKVTL